MTQTTHAQRIRKLIRQGDVPEASREHDTDFTSTIEDAPAVEQRADEPPTDERGHAPPGQAEPSRRRWLTVIALVLTGITGSAIGIHLWTTNLPTDAALRVDDEVVSTAEFDQRDRTLQAIYGTAPPAGDAERDAYRRDVAKSVAVSILLAEAGDEMGVAVPEQEARRLLDDFVQRNFPQGRGAFVAALGEAGTSEAAVLREVALQATTGRLFDAVTTNVPDVTDAEIRQAFDHGREELVVPEQRRIRNIVLPSRTEAQQVADDLRGGVDFSALVSRSLDGSTRDQGGDLGLLPANVFEQVYADAAFAAPLNGVFGPVQTGSGWNVGQVTEISPPRPLGLDEVRQQLREKLETERALEAWREWISQRIDAADISYADDYRPADPVALPPLAPNGAARPAAGPAVPAAASDKIGLDGILLSVGQLVVAASLFLLGCWGRRNADRLAPTTLGEEERAKRSRTYRLGALACQAVAGLLVLTVAYTLMQGIVG